MSDAAPKEKKQYEVVEGLNYPGKGGKEVRVEAGKRLPDGAVSAKAIDWLLAGGHIREVEAES